MDLVARLKKKGLYEEDEDFPGDEEEYYFMVGEGSKYRTDHKVKDKVAMQIKDKAPDEELAAAMLEEDGPLASGGAPAMARMSEEGTKNLMEIMHGETKKVKQRKVKNNDPEAAEKLEPTEPWEQLI